MFLSHSFTAGVGKTSLILTLVSDEFPDEDVSGPWSVLTELLKSLSSFDCILCPLKLRV